MLAHHHRAMKPDNKPKDRIHLHCSRFRRKGKDMDLKKLIEEVMDALAENGSDTYLQFKLMVKASAAENGHETVIRLWDKIFAEADSKRPMLLEMH